MNNSGGLLPKIEALPGILQAEYKGCGKPACRCARGELHGPYLYRRWREGGRQKRQYVKQADAQAVEAALAEWRRLHPPIYCMRQELAELHRLLRQLDAMRV
jgi:hypothetical protein